MTSSEYEEYVTKIVCQFDFCKRAKISNNRKFQGKRQPGEYEIDIAVEVRFSKAIYFLMIIECKLFKLHGASINTVLRDAYAQITSHEDWRQIEALERLAQWENSSIQKLAAFELPEIGKIPEQLTGELLKSVVGDNQEVFRSLIKYRKTPLAMDWPMLPDHLHLHLR
jgi:hypothetical protein